MNISFYNELPGLFGRWGNDWIEILKNDGNHLNYYAASSSPYPVQLPEWPDTDLNIFIAGIWNLFSLRTHGFPKAGKHILWMFDPLPLKTISSENHRYKTELIDKFGKQFDCAICMDKHIEAYFNKYFPSVKTYKIPYTINPKHFVSIHDDSLKTIDILQLGRQSERRKKVEKSFQDNLLSTRFIYGGVYNDKHYSIVADSKISINIQMDSFIYFNQHRIFEAWASGSAVVSEPYIDLDELGIKNGIHLITASLEEMPKKCKDLLNNSSLRNEIRKNAQTLLYNRYSPQVYKNKLLRIIHDL